MFPFTIRVCVCVCVCGSCVCTCVCVCVLGQTFPWKWTLQMMNQPHDCVHHGELQRWHLHHDSKCDELSISHAYTCAHVHMPWITVTCSAVGRVWRRRHISAKLRENLTTLSKSGQRHLPSPPPHTHTHTQANIYFVLPELIRKIDANEMKPVEPFSKTL